MIDALRKQKYLAFGVPCQTNDPFPRVDLRISCLFLPTGGASSPAPTRFLPRYDCTLPVLRFARKKCWLSIERHITPTIAHKVPQAHRYRKVCRNELPWPTARCNYRSLLFPNYYLQLGFSFSSSQQKGYLQKFLSAAKGYFLSLP